MKRHLIAIVMLFFVGLAHGQTFTVTPATGSGPKTATWNVPGGTGCQATGDWSGQKAAAGSELLSNLAVGSHSFVLSCTVPVLGTATLTWAAPTQNTDNTPYTNPQGYILYADKVTPPVAQVQSTLSPTTTGYTVEGLTAATWYFGIKAINTAGTTSDLSGVVSKAVTTSTKPWTATAAADVTLAKPKAPILTVTQ